MSAIEDFLSNNVAHVEAFSAGGLAVAPAKQIAVVSCMDARLPLFAILGMRPGDAHLIRNAGGIVTDDVLRSLSISQRLLGTREVMLIQHTDCGMQTFEDDALKDDIEIATGARPPFAMHAFSDVEASVRDGLSRVRGSRYLAHRDAVRGFIYDVETGRLREID